MRLSLWILAASILFLATPAASAKDFRPGDLRICGATHCRTLSNSQTRAFGTLLYGSGQVVAAPTPPVGAPVFQVRTKDGPLGVVITATAIRVHGLNCGRFQRGSWYRLPRVLRHLTAGLEPKRLRASAPRSC
jgi:hypothetical protein